MSISKELWKQAAKAGREILERSKESKTLADAVDTARRVAQSGSESAKKAADVVRNSDPVEGVRSSKKAKDVAETARATGTSTVGVARALASAGFAKELLKICGKAGAAGAVVDGAVGGVKAAKYVQNGTIDTNQAAKHVGAEAGCGFVTSSSGTAGTLAVFMITGSMGPAALAAGMGASMGSRYLYRKVVGETLPTEEELEQMSREMHRETDESEEGMQDIGPGSEEPSAEASDPDNDEPWENIGPAE